MFLFYLKKMPISVSVVNNTFWIITVDSPKRVNLAGFLHGHPGADETGDQTAGQRKEKRRMRGSKGDGREREIG